jgi:hypothetical protein
VGGTVDLKYPKGFPKDHLTLVEGERIRADRELRLSDPAANESASELERRGLRWVCRILGAFCHEACELGKRRYWTLMQIRAEVENFRLELVRYVHFTVGGRRLGWVDRVFGTSIDAEVRRGIENSGEWQRYQDELSIVADALAGSEYQRQMSGRNVTVGTGSSPANARAALMTSEAGFRERRLAQFKAEHGVTLADIARAAGVHKPEFQKWRKGDLNDESVMSHRIESVLSGKRHLPFGRAVDAGVGPPLLPMVQVRLRFCQALEPLSLQRRLLGMADAGLDFAFGEKRALQTVVAVAQKFSPSHILSTR